MPKHIVEEQLVDGQKWIVHRDGWTMEEFKSDIWPRRDQKPTYITSSNCLFVFCTEEQAIDICYWFFHHVALAIGECWYGDEMLIIDCGILGRGGCEPGLKAITKYAKEYMERAGMKNDH